MKNILKGALKYILVYIGIIILFTVMLLVTSLIPREKIIDNIKESLPYLSEGREIKYVKRKHPFMWLHIYADEMILNIIYNIDEDSIPESVMKAEYYYQGFFNLDTQIKNPNIKPNTEYIRYWHGSMTVLRPMLTIFNIHEIYRFNAAFLSILLLILIVILWRKKNKFLIPIFLIAAAMTGSMFVAFCLEYVWNYYIMLIVCIIAVSMDYNDDKKFYMLFFIAGMVTCFFDFLTTEEITVLVPLVLVVSIRIKHQEEIKFKNMLKFIIFSMAMWFIGYSLTWFAKWVLASIILHINSLDYVVEKASIRLAGDLMNMPYIEVAIKALKKNILALYPLNIIENTNIFIIVPIIIIILCIIFRRKEKNYKKIIPFLVIGIIPYIRYITLVNHSYKHFFFTFRTQFSSIMTILLIIYFCVDIKKFKKIKIKNKIQNEETKEKLN